MNDPTSATSNTRSKILPILGVVFIIIGVAWWALAHFVLNLREKTDDAYVNGSMVVVSSQVPGTVIEVAVENTMLVEAGQVLVRLDPVDAQTQLSTAAAMLGETVRDVRQQIATANQADATVKTRELELKRAELDLAHRTPLLADKAIAGEELRHAEETVNIAHAALEQARGQAAAAHALVDGADVTDNPHVLAAKARYRDAWVTAKRNAVLAPVRGYVAQRSVQLGQRIAPAQPLMTIIPLDEIWVDANFKEGQLRNLRIGQPVEFDSDLYGSSTVFHGHILGLWPGTGAAFSLLPAQNASGNWIKVVQRVPVKVSLDPKELALHPLRVGLSLAATVDTHQRDGAVLAAAPAMAQHPSTGVYAIDLSTADAAADAIIAKNSGR
jgi:membrane fusion protein (multidrug efflux system)